MVVLHGVVARKSRPFASEEATAPAAMHLYEGIAQRGGLGGACDHAVVPVALAMPCMRKAFVDPASDDVQDIVMSI